MFGLVALLATSFSQADNLELDDESEQFELCESDDPIDLDEVVTQHRIEDLLTYYFDGKVPFDFLDKGVEPGTSQPSPQRRIPSLPEEKTTKLTEDTSPAPTPTPTPTPTPSNDQKYPIKSEKKIKNCKIFKKLR